MSLVEKESLHIGEHALESGEHIAYLVYDNGTLSVQVVSVFIK